MSSHNCNIIANICSIRKNAMNRLNNSKFCRTKRRLCHFDCFGNYFYQIWGRIDFTQWYFVDVDRLLQVFFICQRKMKWKYNWHSIISVKSEGLFDQFRRECLADIDTKPAYQNLHHRVEQSVSSFLDEQRWNPQMNKNQVREKLRKLITEWVENSRNCTAVGMTWVWCLVSDVFGFFFAENVSSKRALKASSIRLLIQN